ncbi:sulfotransferase family 2 domain-containing protein [Albidovulum sp.]|uniref:sulfotransferase family 2 domain-containing protein n=1 Tax=Albidovulum sp. TaxID=1872424 RepID=UPI0039B964E9
MPIFRINDKLHYYAHVPKCAGSSVEAYLARRFGTLAFVNTRFLADPEPQRWTKSSPQHLPLDAFHKLIPEDWIASSFAVVRHPVKRLVSAFQFQVEVEGTVAPLWSIDEWFDDWLKRKDSEPFGYDNHIRPMADLVPEDAACFQMEQGLDPVVAHLDRIAGNKEGERSITPENVRKKKMGTDSERLKPSKETLARIADYYAEDFRRFGYAIDQIPKSAHAMPKGLMKRLTEKLGGW